MYALLTEYALRLTRITLSDFTVTESDVDTARR